MQVAGTYRHRRLEATPFSRIRPESHRIGFVLHELTQAMPRAAERLRGLRWREAAFYLGVPLLIGGYAALNNWQLIEAAGPGWAMVFYLAHALVPWLASCLLTGLAMYLLRPWKPAPLVILLAGHTLACLFVLPYVNWLLEVFDLRWPSAALHEEMDTPLTQAFWVYWLRAGVLWVGINLLFDRFLGLPRYRYAVPAGYEEAPAGAETGSQSGEAAAGRPGRPAFLERIPAGVALADVIAVRAEQHYIRVLTASKAFMVLHRFGDALHELEGSEGLQVHRSWWVRKSAVTRLRQNAKKICLVLASGEEIPVSGPYQVVVRQFVRSVNLPVTALTTET